MSEIFDALQRSEAERAGSSSTAPLKAADVLRRAERFAASKWATQAVVGGTETMELDRPVERESFVSSVLGAAPSMTMDERMSILGQFRTMQLSLSSQSKLVSLTDQDGPAAEAFRLLGVRLRDLGRTKQLKKILITSTIPQEGKTTVAANLACTLARSTQRKILLLEGDVRRPALSHMFSLKGELGVCDWLQKDLKLSKCIYHLAEPSLWVMPAGNLAADALEVLQSPKLTSLMRQLTEWFDSIIIDSPPVLPLADTSIWMRLSDGILLVTRQGKTERRELKKGLEALEPEKLIGALMNCSKSSSHSYYYY